ncbi:MAG TPA: fumarylacetoacetate hydrolase family protein [Caldimonas sp.]|jgi:5-carboxymethyl-2-hydroxymuconate isomerase/acylpyruvate hydrolase|nr:fumarylacetoacetate hydrolase family protein [Caldimonas sp.]
MRLLTFRDPDDGRPTLGVRSGQRVLEIAAAARIAGIAGMPTTLKALLAAGPNAMTRVRELGSASQAHDGSRFDAAWRDEATLEYLAPIGDADKFLCVGKNYRQHLEELQRTNLIKEIPDEPTGFVKLNSSLVGHRAKVVRPDGIVRLDYEPELVFVIGRRALGVKKAEAFNYVAGVTILNDLTDRDSQEREVRSGSRFWTGKNIPGFGPLGPELITLDEIVDPYDLWMTCTVNGRPRMRVNTRDQIWKLPDIVEHFSRYIPIEPGDMFSTGAPGGVAVGKRNAAELFLKPGDVVECGIEGFATLRTTIVAPPPRKADAGGTSPA